MLVMLKKQPNNILVSKFKAILLLEADFNTINKIIFNTRLIPILEVQNSILREIIGERHG